MKCLRARPQCFKLGLPAPRSPILPRIEISGREVWWELSVQARGRHRVFLTVGKNPELLASGAVFQMNVADWTRVSVLERSPYAEQKEQTTHPCAHVPHSGMRTPHPEEAPRFQSQVQ